MKKNQKRNSQEILSYDEKEIKERVFYRICQVFPINSFKSFVHKYITTSDDIFVFRKQFATSYGLNSILGYMFFESIIPNNISFNKETVYCAFNDIQYLYFEERSSIFLTNETVREFYLLNICSFFLGNCS